MNSSNKIDEMLKKYYYLIYSILFLTVACLVFFPFIVLGKSFVWQNDGQSQHLTALIYYADWLRGIIRTLFYEYKLTLPMWDMAIGNGSDIITTLHYYVIGDPLNLMAVFVKKSNMEYFYSCLVLLRMLLAGMSFSYYCLKQENDRMATLMGSLVYCFAAYIQYIAIRHPFFMNAMIYFPLMLAGMDQVYKRKKPYLFIIATALAAISNFYFLYMLVIGCVMYAILEYRQYVTGWRVKEMISWFMRFAILGFVALMIAGILFLPNVMNIVTSQRLGQPMENPMLFNARYYKALVVSFIDQKGIGNTARPGIAGIAVLATFFLFCKKGNYRLKTAVGLSICMLVFPFAGSIMNGFSYVSYRCWFLGIFVLGYVLVRMLPDMLTMSVSEKRRLLLVSCIYIALALCLRSVKSERLYFMLVLFLLSLCVCLSSHSMICNKMISKWVLLVLLVINIGSTAYYIYFPKEENYVSEFVERGTAVERLSHHNASKKSYNASEVMEKVKTSMGLSRMEMYGCQETGYNTAMLNDFYGVSFYFSLNNPFVSQFHKDMGLLENKEFKYKDLDCRSYLEALHHVKYFVSDASQGGTYHSSLFIDAPIEEMNGVNLYKAVDTIGFAYAYDAAYAKQEYERLNPVYRQEMLLHAAMLDEDVIPSQLKVTHQDPTARQKEFSVVCGEGVSVQNGRICSDQTDGRLTLYFEGDENCETYVLLSKIKYTGKDMWEKKQQKKWKNADNLFEKLEIIRENERYDEPEKINITIQNEYGKGGAKQVFLTPKANVYAGRDTYLWNMGYSKKAMNYVEIILGEKGEYQLDSIAVYCQPIDEVPTLIKQRKIEGGDQFVAGINTFCGQIKLEEEKLVCFSIPYSKGWSAYIDGKKAPVMVANTMWPAVMLEKGEHEVELKYTTPYLYEGMVCSIVGLCVMLLLYAYDSFGVKRKETNKLY